MESYAIDKSFYDINASELDEIWDDNQLDSTMQDVLRLNSSSDLTVEWNYMNQSLPPAVGVVLYDRLMTDAALGTRPIKTEHSYSLSTDGDSLPNSPDRQKVDDMEEECFPVIRMNCSDDITIKDEPLSESDSNYSSSGPPSPVQPAVINASDLHFEVEPAINLKSATINGSSILISSPQNIIPQRIQIPKTNIKIESGTTTLTASNVFHLPPTPPSCSSSEDSEDNIASQPSSPVPRKVGGTRLMSNYSHSTRQPINTPLISSQPKGSTGTLVLTEEEKRTLIAEGYPVPTRLPLTKAEEKSLKKIRRKIKNKISAQESRRKKKEYMDQLERKVEVLVNENTEYKKKIESLEDSNTNLLKQLQKLQAIVARTHPQNAKQMKLQ